MCPVRHLGRADDLEFPRPGISKAWNFQRQPLLSLDLIRPDRLLRLILGGTRALVQRNRERCEHCPVTDFELLKDVMKMYLDGAVGNIQPSPDFLVRQPYGHQTHDLLLAVS